MNKTIDARELAIVDRFFEALNALKIKGEIRGISNFTTRFKLNQGNLSTVKNNREKWALKTSYLSYLAEGYGVSCRWLLLGEGEMFDSSASS